MFLKAQNSYVSSLWNGEYFRYDSTVRRSATPFKPISSPGSGTPNLTGLGDLVPREMKTPPCTKVYAFNVMKFANGEMGAVNGMAPDGSLLKPTNKCRKSGPAPRSALQR